MRLIRKLGYALGVATRSADGRPRHPVAVSRARWRLRILLVVVIVAAIVPLFIVFPGSLVPIEPAAVGAGQPVATPPSTLALPAMPGPDPDLPPALPAPEPASSGVEPFPAPAEAPPAGERTLPAADGDEASGEEVEAELQLPRPDPEFLRQMGLAVAGLPAEERTVSPDLLGQPASDLAAIAPGAGPLAPDDGRETRTAVLVRPTLRPGTLPPVSQPRESAGTIALIIDDIGPARAWSERAIALPGPLTMSFLPYAEGLPGLIAEARGQGHQIFLHMPMEPIGNIAPGANALLAGMAPDVMRERLAWAVDRVPGAVGMNNHMGSRLTSDAAAMAVVMDELDRLGLAFIDSRTSAGSVAAAAAAIASLPHSARDVFIDHFPTVEFVRRQLASIEATARRTGTAIAIGHPLPVTLAALESWIPAAKARGFTFVTATAVIDKQGCNGQTAAGRCGLRHTVGNASAG